MLPSSSFRLGFGSHAGNPWQMAARLVPAHNLESDDGRESSEPRGRASILHWSVLNCADRCGDSGISWRRPLGAAGDVIEGTGGARKVRFAGKGKGKSGGYRVVTFFTGPDVPVFLLNIFAKNEKTDLKPKERRILKTVLADIARTYRSGRESK